MKLETELGGRSWQVDTEAIDISIPLIFNGLQPNTYGIPGAKAAAFEGSGWVGDVRRGGSCNFESYTFVPHCNGTHTECVGHITGSRIAVHEVLKESFFPATLLSVTPRPAEDSADSYDPSFGPGDLVIDRAMLEAVLTEESSVFYKALIIRTLPNDSGKCSRDYMQHTPAFFTIEAMQFLKNKGMKHLLTDLPSVDRLFDEGKLSAHHIFWDMAPGSTEAGIPLPEGTITEFVYVPDFVADGRYLLEIQVAAFMSDASPSRPRLFRLSVKA